jgi:hypothetical protein
LLEEHQLYLDRIRLSQFKPIPGTRFHEEYAQDITKFSELTKFSWNFKDGGGMYRHIPSGSRKYRKTKQRLLNIAHSVNKKPLRSEAKEFDGLM